MIGDVLMKRKFFCLFILIPIFFSCGMEIPESISIKTKAKYSFSFGEKDFDLKEYISAEKLGSSMGSTEKDPKVYVYNPSGNTKMQYLVSYPIEAIKINLADKNFSEINIPTFEGKKIDQKIEVPKLAADSSAETVNEIDINEMLFGTDGEAQFNIEPVDISEAALGGQVLSKADAEEKNLKRDVNVQITDGGFSTMLLKTGTLLIERTGTSSVPTNLTVELCASDGTQIAVKENIDFSTSSSVSLELSGKTITPKMELFVYGSFESGGSSSYKITPKIEDICISEVSGLTLPEKVITINNEITITPDTSFVSCEVESGFVQLASTVPSEVKGLKVISRNVELSESLSVKENDWNKTESEQTIFDRSYDLKGKNFSESPIKIKFEGSVNYKLENASVVLKNGEPIKIEILPECNISKLKSVVLDLKNHKDEFAIEKIENNFGAQIANDVSKIVLNPSGLKITYKNELPSGNDFKVSYKCELLGLDKELALKASGVLGSQTEEKDFCKQDKEIAVTDSTSFVLEPKLFFPGAAQNPEIGKEYYTTLTGIEPGNTYSILINVEPIFDWKSITVKMSESGLSGLKGEQDSKISLDSMFDSIKESFSDFGNISFKQIELYLYFINPGVSGLDTNSFSGKLYAKSGENTDEKIVYILGSETESKPLDFVKEQELKFNDSKEVILTQDKSKASAYSSDIAKLFNSENKSTSSTIKFGYDMTVSGSSGGASSSEIEISKEFYEKLKKETAQDICIPIEARIIVPLIFDIADNTKLDLKKLKNNGKESSEETDFFNRSEATDMSSYEKFLEVIDSVNLKYKVSEDFLDYSNNASAKIYFGLPGKQFNLDLGKDTIAIKGSDVIEMLKTYPYNPEFYAELPKGTVTVPYFTDAKIAFSMEVITDGEVSIWGGK